MIELLLRFWKYDSWATAQLFEKLRMLSTDELNLPCSGNGTILETTSHLVNVQLSWFSSFDGSMTAEQAMTWQPDPETSASIPKLEAHWREIEAQTWRYLDQLSPEMLGNQMTRTFRSGRTVTFALSDLLLHIANHQTWTRGQIAAAIRLAGHEPGSFDYLRYLMNQQLEATPV